MNKKLLASALTLAAISMANPVFGAGIGVNTHIDHKYPLEPSVELVKGAEIEWVRDSIGWTGVESSFGAVKKIPNYNLDAAKRWEKEGVSQVLVLAYGNNLAYDMESKFVMPTKDRQEYYNAYLEYVSFVVDSVGDYVDAYEIWNEPNFATFNYELEKANGEEYAKLYLDSAKIIKEKDPTARILCGAMMGDSAAARKYGEQIFTYVQSQGDVNELIDVFSIHKYSNDAEGEYASALLNWEAVFDKYGYTGDVWMTENGASTYKSGGFSKEDQAAYVVRCTVLWENYLLETGRNGENFWYDLKNDGVDENNKEHNYGLADYEHNIKPAYNTLKLYNELTNKKSFINYTETENGYIAEYSDGVDKTYILYGESGNTEIAIKADKAYVYDYQGNVTEKISNPDMKKTYTMNGKPVFIECVSNSLKVKRAEYIENKNVVEVEGVAFDKTNVFVTLIKNGEAVQSANVTVNGKGEFKKTLSVKEDGEYVLRLSDGESYITKDISCIRNAEKNTEAVKDVVLVYDADTKSGTVTASVPSEVFGEKVIVAVVSADKELADSTDFIYFDEASAEDGYINKSFKLPEAAMGLYKVLIGRKNAESPAKSEEFMANVWEWAYVCELNTSDASGVVTVDAKVKNFNVEKKDAMLLIAEFTDKNELIKVSTLTKTLEANQKEAITHTLSVKKQSNTAYCKVMVWDSFGNMMPLWQSK